MNATGRGCGPVRTMGDTAMGMLRGDCGRGITVVLSRFSRLRTASSYDGRRGDTSPIDGESPDAMTNTKDTGGE